MNRVVLSHVTFEGLDHIVSRLRPTDYDEIFCTRWGDDDNRQRAALITDCINVARLSGSITVMALLGNEPVAVLGGVQPWPKVWDVWCFGTEKFPQVAGTLTKYVHRTFIPTMLARGLQRAHCRSSVTHTDAHAWLRSFGAHEEIPLKAWGKNGEDFIMFEWLRDKLLETYAPAEAA